MKQFLILAALTIFTASAPAKEPSTELLTNEARSIVKHFATTLKGELQAAIQNGGLVKAVEVCHKRAPEIAENLASKHGWKVGRTSLRHRNPNNEPDAWELQMLNQFEERKAAGETLKSLDHAATTNQNGKSVFRYMKAIPTEGICLGCHGADTVPSEVELALEEYYPNDRARGFKEGDIRGAFTLSKTDQ